MTTSNSPSKNNRKIKNYLIHPRFQFKFVILGALSGMVISLFNALVFYLFTRENYLILVDLAPMSEDVKLQLHSELRTVAGILLFFSFGFIAISAVLGLIISHRAAGPLFQFKKVFEAIRDGNRQRRIHLRPHDDFREVALVFNDMMDSISGKAASSDPAPADSDEPKLSDTPSSKEG